MVKQSLKGITIHATYIYGQGGGFCGLLVVYTKYFTNFSFLLLLIIKIMTSSFHFF